MDKIVCLVGESGSGKTTIAELLEKEGYNYIQSYTTRPKRYENEKGHIFITREEVIEKYKIQYDPKVIETNRAIEIALHWSSVAYTFFDGEHYFSTEEQYKGKGKSIYVIDVAGVKELKEKIKDAEIVVIYLKADEKERHIRLWDRYFEQSGETYMNDETLKGPLQRTDERIKHDKNVFTVISCDYVVDANRDIEEVLEDVSKIVNNIHILYDSGIV